MRYITTLSVTATVVLLGSPAQAHDNGFGWFDCSQRLKLNSSNVRVGVTSTAGYTFPADGFGDGVSNSFTGRIYDAAVRWNTEVRKSKAFGVTWAGTGAADVRFYYHDLGDTSNGVTKYGTTCGVHKTPRKTMPLPVSITMNIKPTWFTQDDSRRLYWEECPLRGYDPAYTCSKSVDFGSSATHEIGHALGLPHPWDVSSHVGSTYPESSSWANCGSTNDMATMCYSPDYRTTRRTLHAWDSSSLHDALTL